MQKLRRVLLIISCIVLISVGLIVAFVSPITKYLVEKHDVKQTGRQITMNWAYVNPFTGYIYFDDLKIYEHKNDTVFFSAKGLSANIAMVKLFTGTYEISELSLYEPRGTIIQTEETFNYSDLIERFSPKGKSKGTPVHFNVLNIKIKEGAFYFHEKQTPVDYFITNVNIDSPGLRWNADTIATIFSFKSGPASGAMKGELTLNFKKLDYRILLSIADFDLTILEQYLKELTTKSVFRAKLDAKISAKGNLNDKEDVTSRGMIAISDLHFGNNAKEDYLSFDKLVLAIHEISPKNHKYFYDSVSLTRPYIKYERYDHLDNLQTMFGKAGGKIDAAQANPEKFNLVIEIAKYVEVLSKNFFKSNYKINRLAIYDADIKFNDFSISEKFSIDLNPLTVIADSIDKLHKRVEVLFHTGIKPYGEATVSLSINPKDSGDFDMNYHLHKLPVAMFNPYLVTYTSFPLDRGTLSIKGQWNVRNSNIKSVNHLVIIDPRVNERVRSKDSRWVPMPMLMALVRERGNVIDYQVPISGSLKDPKLHLKDVVFDLLENILVKPPTTPYRMEVKKTEREIEKALTLTWGMNISELRRNQEKFIERMADYLVSDPKARINVYPQLYTSKEKEHILFFEAKKKYFMSVNKISASAFNNNDAEVVNRMSVKDSLFVSYLDRHTGDSLFTVQDKCGRLIGHAKVEAEYEKLIQERQAACTVYFKKRDVSDRIKFYASKEVIPYNGFSLYKIEYKGELPEALTEAYGKMEELNNETPRKQFRKERKRNKNR